MKDCKYKKYCGNCSYLDIDYEEQLINKTKTLQELLDQNNIKVNCWTIDSIKDAQDLIDLGVDMITSNCLE